MGEIPSDCPFSTHCSLHPMALPAPEFLGVLLEPPNNNPAPPSPHTHTFGFVLHMLELLFVLLPHDYLHLRMFRHSYLNVDMMLSARYFHFLFLCYSNCVTSIDLSSSSQTLFSVISHLKFLQKVILLQLDQSCSTLKNFSNV